MAEDASDPLRREAHVVHIAQSVSADGRDELLLDGPGKAINRVLAPDLLAIQSASSQRRSELRIQFGALPDRIETTVSIDRARELGAKTENSVNASTPEVLAELADLVAAGAVEVPIAATCPLDRITDALAQLERRQARGKIVLIPGRRDSAGPA